MVFNIRKLYVIQIVCTVHFVATVRGKNYRECLGIDKVQKYVASRDNCAKYIYCDGNNSFEAVVCRVGQQLMVDDSGGAAQSNQLSSQWNYGSQINNIGGPLDGWRLDGTYYNTNIGSGQQNVLSNWNVIVSQMSTQLQPKQEQLDLTQLGMGGVVGNEVVAGVAQNAIDMGYTGTTTAVAEPPLCPIRYGLPNVFYLPNRQSCSAYYACYNGIAIPMVCPRQSYFNLEMARCEQQNNIYCPYDRPVRLICNRGVYDYIPNPRKCGYYYFCSNGYLMIFQCPNHYLWHYERRTCVHHSEAKCFSSAIAETMLSRMS
ncbi:uncharacterized protein LOC101449251 isoform X2 [Ceratitis capitata]|uniref:uncharacterized protein LOC101449251 isoform X2 n=1 Tax=Ceratitis capitata TaxID=7213 RepID=UPI000A11933A|nr:uncharacterized protein LOC101449251 isoform X2 [Ceratitis capitata]